MSDDPIPLGLDTLCRGSPDLSLIEGALGYLMESDGDGRVLLVASASPGEGRTTVAYCLAAQLAASAPTLLIDAHLRQQGLTRLFRLSSAPGLTDMVLDDVAHGPTLRQTGIGNLAVLAGGRRIAGGQSIFSTPACTALLASLRREWTNVVIDAAPCMSEPDAALLAPQVDGIVLVLDCRRTRWEVARLVVDQMERAGGRVIGTVLSRREYPVPGWLYRRL